MIIQRLSKRDMSFLAQVIYPTLVTIALFLTAIFLIVIPIIEKNSIDSKREMIRELTTSALNILATLEYGVQQGEYTREVAQQQAVIQIRNQFYGRQTNHYFWINDLQPRMIFHPYRPDLAGQDLSTVTDADGKQIFVEMVKLVESKGDGYVEYKWQWMDEQQRVLPKISYVKGFAPWGWMIGTGIYLDDVKREISVITHSLIQVSLFVLLVISLLLIYIGIQSFTALKQQQLAENALRESEEKYRTLVDSAAEGMFMVLEGSLMYVNQTIADMLGYSADELSGRQVEQIFPENRGVSENDFLKNLLEGGAVPDRFEARLNTKSGAQCDVTLSATRISMGGKTGFMAVVSDITHRKRVANELEASERKFRTMAANLNVGFFRMIVHPEIMIVEANPALVEMLGYGTRESLLAAPLEGLFPRQEEFQRIVEKIESSDLRREVATLRKCDGSSFSAAIWGSGIRNAEGFIVYFDGIIEDISDVFSREAANRKVLAELQSTVMFFSKKLGDVQCQEVVSCYGLLPVKDAVRIMQEKNADVLLVRDEAGAHCGVVTDHDLRKALLPTGSGIASAVSDIMTAGYYSLPPQSSLLDAWGVMMCNNVSHVFITNTDGEITGYINKSDLLAIQNYSPSILLREISTAETPDEIIRLNTVQPHLISTLIESGAKPQSINSLTTSINDAIRRKFIDFARKDLGPAPAKFAFLVFGSEGREEQTLHTDQDNAIVYDDVSPEMAESVRDYFLAMGKKVCTWLNDAGYVFCKGNNMAMNPELCQPSSVWKKYFGTWVYSATGEDLLRTKIFFDFRCAYGDESLVDRLREHLNRVIFENFRFLQILARDILNMGPPIGRFGKFVVETSGENRGGLDIKKSMVPIVDFARIYALKHGIAAANTIKRLDALRDLNVLTDQNHQEMVQAYCFLMQMRLKNQADAVSNDNKSPDNIIYPKKLSSIEQQLLKEIFSQTKYFQVRLSFDFTGQSGDA